MEQMETDIQEPSIDESLNILFDNILNGINTCQVGKVLKYDKTTNMATIQPIFKAVHLNDDNEEIIKDKPVIENVLVYFQRSGGYYCYSSVNVGDIGLLFTVQRSIDGYLEGDGKNTIDPIDNRKFDLSDSVFFPGLTPKKNKIINLPQTVFKIAKVDDSIIIQIASNGEVQIKTGAVRLGSLTANLALAMAQKTNARLDALESFQNTHIHIDPLSAVTGIVSVPFIAGGGDVSSTKVFSNG